MAYIVYRGISARTCGYLQEGFSSMDGAAMSFGSSKPAVQDKDGPQSSDFMNKTRVLVADDEPRILELLKAMLEPHGFQVTTALSAREALGAIQKANAEHTPYQLLITDIRMPGMSGLGLLHNLMAMEPRLPAIAITAYHTDDLPAQLEQCGCRLCFHKPFNQQQLLNGIAETLAAS
jgi:CheY-like chemotaxis protein